MKNIQGEYEKLRRVSEEREMMDGKKMEKLEEEFEE